MCRLLSNLCPVTGLFKNQIRLKYLSDSELDSLPYYMKPNVSASELLNVWDRLPKEFLEDYNIQILLPCFVREKHNNLKRHQQEVCGQSDFNR